MPVHSFEVVGWESRFHLTHYRMLFFDDVAFSWSTTRIRVHSLHSRLFLALSSSNIRILVSFFFYFLISGIIVCFALRSELRHYLIFCECVFIFAVDDFHFGRFLFSLCLSCICLCVVYACSVFAWTFYSTSSSSFFSYSFFFDMCPMYNSSSQLFAEDCRWWWFVDFLRAKCFLFPNHHHSGSIEGTSHKLCQSLTERERERER